jgi:hypothetical protein
MGTGETPPPRNAYEAFWDCLEDNAPVASACADGRDAYRQFWDLTESD